MEHGVYTPFLDKVLDICCILCITLNDLIIEGREFDQYKQKTFESLDASIIDIADTIKIIEELRTKTMIAKQNKDEQAKRNALDTIIQIFAWKNKHMWQIADFLYFQKLDRALKKASSSTLENLMDTHK